MSKIKTIFIVGPTASGKTALSIKIAEKVNGEIVSADSMQLYKGIHIASAAPDAEEMRGIPHHLIELLDLTEEFSVADYVKKAKDVITDIASRGKTPIVVGGTGLYISSLLDNTEFLEEAVDQELREKLEQRFSATGAEAMLGELALFDPETAKRLHPNNKRRIIRAFEVYLQTGKSITEQNALSKLNESMLDALVIGITYKDRQKLYDKINKRVDIMIENGLLQEAETTLKQNSKKGGFQAIGHKELYSYIENECDFETAVEHLKQQTRRYAKRQLTWFNRDSRINWIYADIDNPTIKALCLVNEFLKEETN